VGTAATFLCAMKSLENKAFMTLSPSFFTFTDRERRAMEREEDK
jgi:hypothetical protein